MGAGEKAQRLKAVAGLPEGFGLIASTHDGYNHLQLQFQGI